MKDEFSAIDEIAKILGQPSRRTRVGLGDDAAIMEKLSGYPLFCSDALVEGVHFDLSFAKPEEVGHKALASCLSDLAAMNGTPISAVITLALPKQLHGEDPAVFLRGFYQGAKELTESLGVDIIGGDLVASPGTVFIDVSCIGETHHPFLRSGARPGDWLAVSGTPGLSAAGLAALLNQCATPFLRRAHLQPRPRFDLLPALSTLGLCTAAIDVSDGISSEVNHLARRSSVGFEIEAAKIPLHPEAIQLANRLRKSTQENHDISALNWALTGGEDYELLVTLNPAVVESMGGVPKGFTIIGRATDASSGVVLIAPDGQKSRLQPQGYNHFANK